MGDHKHEMCRKGLHRMEGWNAGDWLGKRHCRACRNESQNKRRKEKRKIAREVPINAI